LNHRQVAEEIYTASDGISNSGSRAYYRKLRLRELPEADRWIVKTHLTAIGRKRLIESARKNNRELLG
jgi:hypothetical protein